MSETTLPPEIETAFAEMMERADTMKSAYGDWCYATGTGTARARYESRREEWWASVDALRTLLAPMVADRERTCEWRFMDYPESASYYESACGGAWSFTNGGLEENDMTFCNRCGGKILFVPPGREVDDDEAEGDAARGAA